MEEHLLEQLKTQLEELLLEDKVNTNKVNIIETEIQHIENKIKIRDRDIERIVFMQECNRYGLTMDDYKKDVLIGGIFGELIGIRPLDDEFPFIVKANGVRYKVNRASIN